MERRRVSIIIGGQICSFYSDDSDEYITELARRANAVMKRTVGYSGASAYMNAVLSIVSLTDALMRAETERVERPEPPAEVKRPRKTAAKAEEEDDAQVSVWELLKKQEEAESAKQPEAQVSVWDLLGSEEEADRKAAEKKRKK